MHKSAPHVYISCMQTLHADSPQPPAGCGKDMPLPAVRQHPSEISSGHGLHIATPPCVRNHQVAPHMMPRIVTHCSCSEEQAQAGEDGPDASSADSLFISELESAAHHQVPSCMGPPSRTLDDVHACIAVWPCLDPGRTPCTPCTGPR